MRRFLTLVFVLGLAVPAGISITGCTRNPAAKYCPCYERLRRADHGGHFDRYAARRSAASRWLMGRHGRQRCLRLIPALAHQPRLGANQYSYGTTNNQLVDISPSGRYLRRNMESQQWWRHSRLHHLSGFPSPAPETKGLPYSRCLHFGFGQSVTSNPVAVYVHAPVTSVDTCGAAVVSIADGYRAT